MTEFRQVTAHGPGTVLVQHLRPGQLQEIMAPPLQMSGLRNVVVPPSKRTQVRKRVATRLDITALRKMVRRLEMRLRNVMVYRPTRTRIRKRAATRLDITALRKAMVRRLEMGESGAGKEANRLLIRSGFGSARLPGIAYPFARHRSLLRPRC